YTAGADYLDLTNKDNWGAFYRLVIQAVSEVENPTGMSMNKELFGLVQTIAKEYGTKGETRDLFGTIVPAWDSSIPFIRLLDGCITNTEPDGDDVAHCTSLFIHSFAQEDFSLLTNSGLDWKDFDWMESKESGKFIWEVRAQWKPALPQKVLRVMKLKVK
ncbi:MAG TPA: hypothetical protein VHI13_05160, partial [Candidatus Kapabacteria bacterium]|nr:hypothetical protein [Candidatus Kapabacteria bacterium]